MSAVLAAALAYAAHGWPVHPLYGPERRVPHPGKQPVLGRWQEQAATDPDVIRGWWERWDDSNIGIVTGPRSGLAVLDVDPRSGGTDSLAELEERTGVLPGTVQSVTGGGGVHLLYRHPGAPIKSRAHSLGPGLDVKADGGQIVAPPSLHPSGRRYAWLGGVWPGCGRSAAGWCSPPSTRRARPRCGTTSCARSPTTSCSSDGSR